MENLKVKMDDLGVLPFQEPTHFSWVKNSHFESFGINGEVYEPAKN